MDMAKAWDPSAGEPPRRYGFIMNPYPDVRLSICPVCHRKTGQRKLPLLIDVGEKRMVALNYTCRYCRGCDLLAAHKHEIERLLTDLFVELDPDLIGGDYLVFGTLEKKHWRENMKHPRPPAEVLKHAFMFKTYKELQMTRGGWFPAGIEPPIAEPPPSREWTRARGGRGAERTGG